jgi:hypothetical protein
MSNEELKRRRHSIDEEAIVTPVAKIKIDKADAATSTPLPKGEMLAMGILFFTEGYNFTFVFSVCYFLFLTQTVFRLHDS